MDAKRIHEIMIDSLFKADEPTTDFVAAEGVTGKFGFHPGRLESHREEIRSMIDDLNPEFLISGGGGGSFLNLCMDKHGSQWGDHPNCEEFVTLCVVLRFASYCLPRDMWKILPGGVPYIVFTKDENETADEEKKNTAFVDGHMRPTMSAMSEAPESKYLESDPREL